MGRKSPGNEDDSAFDFFVAAAGRYKSSGSKCSKHNGSPVFSHLFPNHVEYSGNLKRFT